MNSTNKKAPAARGIPQPFKLPVSRASQLKPAAQLKPSMRPQTNSRPNAPAVYKPQKGASAKTSVAPTKRGGFAPNAGNFGAWWSSVAIQRNIPKGGASKHNFDAKNVPQRVKRWAANAAPVVRQQYKITLANVASNPGTTGDGALGYLNNWFHKRFGGQYCLLFLWQARRDGNGDYLAVQGIGRKNGAGNDYDLDD